MSLIKIAYIAGDKNLFNKLKSSITASANSIPKEIVRGKIIEMYDKYTAKPSLYGINRFDIKRSRGGLATINFVVQALVLLEENIRKEFLGKETAEIINILSSSKEYADIGELETSYRFFKNLENSIIFALNAHKLNIPEDTEKRKQILRCGNFTLPEKFNNNLAEFIKLNNKMFGKYVQTKP
jgi:glutamine synthetase adenylyltransferase